MFFRPPTSQPSPVQNDLKPISRRSPDVPPPTRRSPNSRIPSRPIPSRLDLYPWLSPTKKRDKGREGTYVWFLVRCTNYQPFTPLT
jgi:hypothetical protein